MDGVHTSMSIAGGSVEEDVRKVRQPGKVHRFWSHVGENDAVMMLMRGCLDTRGLISKMAAQRLI